MSSGRDCYRSRCNFELRLRFVNYTRVYKSYRIVVSKSLTLAVTICEVLDGFQQRSSAQRLACSVSSSCLIAPADNLVTLPQLRGALVPNTLKQVSSSHRSICNSACSSAPAVFPSPPLTNYSTELTALPLELGSISRSLLSTLAAAPIQSLGSACL